MRFGSGQPTVNAIHSTSPVDSACASSMATSCQSQTRQDRPALETSAFRLLSVSGTTGVRPDSVEVLGGTLSHFGCPPVFGVALTWLAFSPGAVRRVARKTSHVPKGQAAHVRLVKRGVPRSFDGPDWPEAQLRPLAAGRSASWPLAWAVP